MVSAPITSTVLRLPAPDEVVGDREGIDEAGANSLHIESRTARHARARLHLRGAAGKVWSGVVVATMMRSSRRRRVSASASARFGRFQREIGCRLAARPRYGARECRCARRSTRRTCRPFLASSSLVTMLSGRYDRSRRSRDRMTLKKAPPPAGVNARALPLHDRRTIFGDALSAFAMSIAISERARKAQRIGAAMALHDNAVQAQKHPAIVARGSSLLAKRCCSAPAAPIARRSGRTASASGRCAGNARRAWRCLRRLQRDIAGEAVGDDDVDRAVGDVVAFDEAAEFDRQIARGAGFVRRPSPRHGLSCPRRRH